MIPFTASEIVAALALVLSCYATWRTVRFHERQKTLIEVQERLQRQLLAKEENQALAGKKADLGASFLRLGSSRYRLKIFNKGNSSARNVTISFPEGNDCLIQSDIDSKFPLEMLDTHQSVELIAAIHMRSKSKQVIKLAWSDEFSPTNEKVLYPTL